MTLGWADYVFLAVAVPPTVFCLVVLVDNLRGLLPLPVLEKVAVGQRQWPLLTIVTPACDEEGEIEAAVRSMLRQDYPSLEVVAVDDRSTDRTGEILEGLAAEDDRLEVVRIDELPEGWLGKLNALHQGTVRSRGQWILFADADADLAPTALRKAVTYAESQRLDLLTVVPTVRSAGFVGDAVFSLSMAMLPAGGRLQKVMDSSSDKVAAGGAFILVRREAFERTPGFEWIKLEVADDFGLCLLLKAHGGRCAIINGRSEVSITWYGSYLEMVGAMQKNFFAIMGGFSVAKTTGQAAFMAWLALFPLAALLPLETPVLATIVALGEAAILAAMVVASAVTRRPLWGAFFPPVALLAMAFMVIRSGIIGARAGGIYWRGVLYPTELLRHAQRVKL